MDFILKPAESPAIEFSNMRAIPVVQRDYDRELFLKVKRGIKKIGIDEIYYVEVIGHKLIYHTVHGQYETWDTLKGAEQTLSHFGFARCNNCFLVNLNAVTEITGDSVRVGDTDLKVSRLKKKSFIEALILAFGDG